MSTLDRITKLRGDIAAASESIDTALAAADTEERQLTADELSDLEQTRASIEGMTAELEQLVKVHNVIVGADALAPVNVPRAHTAPREPSGDIVAATAQTVGERFVGSDELRDYRGGRSSSLVLPDITPSQFALGHTRATLVESDAPYATLATAPAGVVAAPVVDKPRPLLEVIGRAPTSLASVPVLITGSSVAGAAVVAEGAAKPEVTWTDVITSIPVETIAGWKKASRQIIEDVALMRNLIDTQLTRSVLNAVEARVLGEIGDAITGANTSTGEEDQPLLEVIREALGAVEGRNHTANAIMLNPADYATLDIAVLSKTLLGPVVGSQFWGLRVVSNPNVSAGTAYVGDFATAVTLFERVGMSMYVTDSDISGAGASAASDFRKNILTFLAEIRAVPVVLDTTAIQAAVFTNES